MLGKDETNHIRNIKFRELMKGSEAVSRIKPDYGLFEPWQS